MSLVEKYDWVETNSPVASGRTDDISFLTPDLGWLVNSNGQVAKTEDGGDNWTVQLTVSAQDPGKPYLRSIKMANSQVGWFGAILNHKQQPDDYQKYLLHTTRDGGATWQRVENLPMGSPPGICGLSVVNESVVYASGTNDPSRPAGVVKTLDGGATWQLLDMSPWATNLIDIHFFDENRGYVVGGKNQDECSAIPPGYTREPQYAHVKPVVLYTEDGGESWVNRVAGMDFDCGEWGWKLFFVNDQVFFVSLENFVDGNILRTLDGGMTWEKFHVNDRRPLKFGQEVSNANLEGIGFIDQDFGWVGGWGDVNFIGTYNSVTQDGGQSWLAEDFAVNANLQPVGDLRLNVNRYQFFGDPVHTGYCSGKKVYKLVIHGSDPPLAVAASSAKAASAAHAPKPSFKLQTESSGKGHLTIHYDVPQAGSRVQLGLWNQFAFHFRTLVDTTDVAAGPQSVTWDGTDDDGQAKWPGAVIVRLTIDGRTESATVPLP